jgi:hypothetical protein
MPATVQLGHGRELVTQAISVGAASTQIGAPFGAQTRQIRIAANTACNVQIGDGSAAATAASPFLPANAIEYVMVSPGEVLAAIQAATGGLVTTTAGTLWVTELG